MATYNFYSNTKAGKVRKDNGSLHALPLGEVNIDVTGNLVCINDNESSELYRIHIGTDTVYFDDVLFEGTAIELQDALIDLFFKAGGAASTTLSDNLTTSTTGTALDAHQGYVLKGLIDTNTTNIATKADKTGTSDIEITDNTKGVILKSPNGTRFRLTVNNDGSLTTTAL
jgi:hypothetical protein